MKVIYIITVKETNDEEKVSFGLNKMITSDIIFDSKKQFGYIFKAPGENSNEN